LTLLVLLRARTESAPAALGMPYIKE
jgi:hypothetical protein